MRRLLIGVICLTMWTSAFAAPTICLDPGHPSEVGSGTAGKSISEVKAVWLVAVELKKLLVDAGYQVVMTKSKETQMVRNRRRSEIANAAKADLMLRLHCDSANESGLATFYPARKGTAEGVTGPSDSVMKSSAALANPFHRAVMSVLKGSLKDRGVRTEQMTAIGAKQGALTGSIFSKVPVLLVEMAVLNQPEDNKFMASAKGRALLAKALLAGVKQVVPLPRRSLSTRGAG